MAGLPLAALGDLEDPEALLDTTMECVTPPPLAMHHTLHTYMVLMSWHTSGIHQA